MKIKFEGKNYYVFTSEEVRKTFKKNEFTVDELLQKYSKKPFTGEGSVFCRRMFDKKLCVICLRREHIKTKNTENLFIVVFSGNYKILKLVHETKFLIKLDCGHLSVIDDEMETPTSGHVVRCFKCNSKKYY